MQAGWVNSAQPCLHPGPQPPAPTCTPRVHWPPQALLAPCFQHCAPATGRNCLVHLLQEQAPAGTLELRKLPGVQRPAPLGCSWAVGHGTDAGCGHTARGAGLGGGAGCHERVLMQVGLMPGCLCNAVHGKAKGLPAASCLHASQWPMAPRRPPPCTDLGSRFAPSLGCLPPTREHCSAVREPGWPLPRALAARCIREPRGAARHGHGPGPTAPPLHSRADGPTAAPTPPHSHHMWGWFLLAVALTLRQFSSKKCFSQSPGLCPEMGTSWHRATYGKRGRQQAWLRAPGGAEVRVSPCWDRAFALAVADGGPEAAGRRAIPTTGHRCSAQP